MLVLVVDGDGWLWWMVMVDGCGGCWVVVVGVGGVGGCGCVGGWWEVGGEC